MATKAGSSRPSRSLGHFLCDELELSCHAYVPILLLLSFAAACIDVFSLPSLRIFVANNTGNLILLSLAVGQLESLYPELVRPVPCIVSLVCSWVGSWLSGYMGRHFGKRRRGYLFGDTIFQAVLTFLCAGLYYGHVIGYLDSRTEYVTISLMSLTMGQQNVMVKATKVPPTIPTTVATGSMADIFSDPQLLAPPWQNRFRNERVTFVLTFFFGGVVGALAYRYSTPELSLLLTAILKLLAAVGFLLAGAAKPKQAEEKVQERVLNVKPGESSANGSTKDIPVSTV